MHHLVHPHHHPTNNKIQTIHHRQIAVINNNQHLNQFNILSRYLVQHEEILVIINKWKSLFFKFKSYKTKFIQSIKQIRPIEQNNETDFQQQSQQPNENDDDSSTGNICNEDEYNKIFRPKNEIKRLKQPQSPPVISNHVPITHAALKRETSPPPPSKSVYTPRPNILAHQPISTPQPQLKSPIVEKIPQPHVHQSIPTKEMLDKKINDNNQFGVNMNDFMPV